MIDCLVIGAGHCGLTCAYLLRQTDLKYRVVDESPRVGHVWRERPQNLRLFTSRQFCRLGDTVMDGDPGSFPTGREFADHLERFATKHQFPLSLQTRVVRLRREDTLFIAELDNGETIRCRTVINATGSNQQVNVPAFAGALGSSVIQLSAAQYRDATQLPAASRIAVIGDGASGRQIARKLAESHVVLLARGRKRNLLPNVVLGRDIFWWLSKMGFLFAPPDSLVGRILRERNPVPAASDSDSRLAAAGVLLRPRAVDGHGRQITFSNGDRETVDAVIWCSGYAEDLSWLDLPGINHRTPAPFTGSLGRTSEEGFYVVGRKWLSCRASELILGAERDAARIVPWIVETCRARLPHAEALANA